jgi:hypothetical protein
VGRDGGSYGFDLGQTKTGIFFRKGLDRRAAGKRLICPSGNSAWQAFHTLLLILPDARAAAVRGDTDRSPQQRVQRLRDRLCSWSLPVPKSQKIVDLALSPAMIPGRKSINAGIDADVANKELGTLDKVGYLINGSSAETACGSCHCHAPSPSTMRDNLALQKPNRKYPGSYRLLFNRGREPKPGISVSLPRCR